MKHKWPASKAAIEARRREIHVSEVGAGAEPFSEAKGPRRCDVEKCEATFVAKTIGGVDYCDIHYRAYKLRKREDLRIQEGKCPECKGELGDTPYKRKCLKCGWKTRSDGIPFDILVQLLEAQGNKCNYCRIPLSMHGKMEIQLDHKVPKARGGSDALENRQFLYQVCNVAKWTMSEGDFRSWIKRVYANLFPAGH